MTFLDHVEELRAAVWRSATVALILIAGAWFYSGRLLDALILYLLHGEKRWDHLSSDRSSSRN
ncbi:MAG TPA: hypothetical protein VE402_03565 [Candidatus Angelobacter sp.]|nr:hypothetical protein [Candidatus Angelobacter sp.]